MFTILFQLFFTLATLGLIVAAIQTHRADRRTAAFKAHHRAHSVAHALIMLRVESGYYDTRSVDEMKKDYTDKYNKLINS